MDGVISLTTGFLSLPATMCSSDGIIFQVLDIDRIIFEVLDIDGIIFEVLAIDGIIFQVLDIDKWSQQAVSGVICRIK